MVNMLLKTIVILSTLTAPALSVDSLRLIVMGDWGGLPYPICTTPLEKNVANQMNVIASRYGANAILALGDNFYYTGVGSINDVRFKCTWEDVYTYDPLKTIPWYLIAGNHDHHGNVSAQIAYSSRAEMWNFPNYYYRQSFKAQGKTVDIIMIDTVLLCGNTLDGSHKQPKGPERQDVADQQLEWIKQQMAESSADYLLVAGHFPVYSIAEHGPTQCLIDNLLPLLVQYRAVYLCGHDHNLQHLQFQKDGVLMELFVSGSANFADLSNAHVKDVPENSSKFFWTKKDTGGFGFMEFTADNATFSFTSGDGKPLYSHVLYPRKTIFDVDMN